nr:MAG TPA: hypothetical protein [Caudoviricetes sp.]
MAWRRGIPSTHGRVHSRIGGCQWYWHRWISLLAVRICRYRQSHSHLRVLQAVQHLGLQVFVQGLEAVISPAVAEDSAIDWLAAISTVQALAVDGVHQHRRGAGQNFLLAGTLQKRFHALQRVRQGSHDRVFARLDKNTFHLLLKPPRCVILRGDGRSNHHPFAGSPVFQHRRAFLRSCVPPVLPVLRLFGAGVAAVDVLAALSLALCGMVAQPGKEQRQQQQHHRGDEVGAGDDPDGFDAACKAKCVQHPDGTAGNRQPVKDARFDSHADASFAICGKKYSPIFSCGIWSTWQIEVISLGSQQPLSSGAFRRLLSVRSQIPANTASSCCSSPSSSMRRRSLR